LPLRADTTEVCPLLTEKESKIKKQLRGNVNRAIDLFIDYSVELINCTNIKNVTSDLTPLSQKSLTGTSEVSKDLWQTKFMSVLFEMIYLSLLKNFRHAGDRGK
jgi:hypothetical protein